MTAESKYNENTQLSNDPIIINDEIEAIHRKIFHLRRTNNEIRKHYSDDADCIEALNENVLVIERNLNSLFLYFDLYEQLTNKQHFYVKLYESDLKTREKLSKHSVYHEQNASAMRKLNEFDLEYVAQRLREKSKQLEAEKKEQEKHGKQQPQQRKKKDDENDKNQNDDCIVDDDGGFTL